MSLADNYYDMPTLALNIRKDKLYEEESVIEKYLVKRVKEIGGRAPKWVSPRYKPEFRTE